MSSPNTGENNLPILLASMRPTVHQETFVFLTTTQRIENLPLQSLKPEMLSQEDEGLSIITTKDLAESNGLRDYTFPCKKISLAVHSSLEAVGLIAAISSKLASHGISTNVVSGYFHDHIFVPLGKEDAALQVLQDMMKAAESTVQK
ncbi:hypothetical protein Asppvi_010167 [Aspergillus pseudoviridinutans]|uniref:DUF2241 domain-containing protein n=1 Tax=Aspergillus pseudoviridinutans TaxID=1517512 RepID=A0A9P3BH55_9EURO|nr:uncharacterized protein Asppvi_010167 [Aspergillus pseudoviridinutans]GIJ91202.1 hypothetical protein Asppvi_010167 [Aspergillus pseudoviridinutans]